MAEQFTRKPTLITAMQAEGKKLRDDINVTPMVDPNTVLLLIFIIMTTAGVYKG